MKNAIKTTGCAAVLSIFLLPMVTHAESRPAENRINVNNTPTTLHQNLLQKYPTYGYVVIDGGRRCWRKCRRFRRCRPGMGCRMFVRCRRVCRGGYYGPWYWGGPGYYDGYYGRRRGGFSIWW